MITSNKGENMAKYIFVTGGVISSLGKGITAASIGSLLKSSGFKVNIVKIDPYLNVDPGTMSPFQHGEVYVTDDGAETDLDLGYYERFLDIDLSQDNNITSGSVYNTVITKERKGEYLGKTVQVVPHITDEIKSRLRKLSGTGDIIIVEIGGTTGDIEGLPFLEAIRQFRQDTGEVNVCHIHVTLVPYIRAAEEMKTKPTQQSVAKLREIGIQPDIIVCRTERPLNTELKQKIALFCAVAQEAVIEERDVDVSIYEVPIRFHEENIVTLILKKLQLKDRKGSIAIWEDIVDRIISARDTITIAIAGKYTQLKDAYKSIWEAISHGGIENRVVVKIKHVDVEKRNLEKELEGVDGILIPGGFGVRGIEGKVKVAGYARKNKIPFFGLCLGLHCSVISFARDECKLKGANSTEFNKKTKYPVIDLLHEQKSVVKKGGTMRLGAYPCGVKKNSLAYSAYKKTNVKERHRHRFEFNNRYRKQLESKGLVISGVYKKKNLVEMVEVKAHPWYVAVQFHPEFKSRPNRAHPLFREFIKAAVKFNNTK